MQVPTILLTFYTIPNYVQYLLSTFTTVLHNLNQSVHCAKISLNLRTKTEPVTAGADATVFVGVCAHIHYTVYLAHKPDIYCSTRAPDRFSLNVEIHII